MDIIIYQDNNLLVIDKPAGISVYGDKNSLINILLRDYPELKQAGEAPRYGIVHRLDKDTSGLLIVAKNNESLIFLQKQFKNRRVEKKYIALSTGVIKQDGGTIETLIGRSPKDGKKQRAFFIAEPGSENKRQAITEYRVVERYQGYTLLELCPKTGRKHQIRCHLEYIKYPMAGDKLYAFKRQPVPKNLTHHFLHARYLKIQLPDGQTKEFESKLPEDLKNVLKELKKYE